MCKVKSIEMTILFFGDRSGDGHGLYTMRLLVGKGPQEMIFLSKISINGTIIIC